MRRFAVTLIVILAVVAAVAWLAGGTPTTQEELMAGLDMTWPRTVALGLLAAVLTAGMIAGGPRLKEVGSAIAVWGLLALVLVAVYAYRHDLTRMAQTTLAAVVPGMAVSVDEGVAVSRGADGHFRVRGSVNGAPVTFLLDTGASLILLTSEDAAAAGVRPDRAAFSLPVSTANGLAEVAPVTLSDVSVGSISENEVSAAVAPPGSLSSSLLGMSFLSRLYRFEITGDRLVLQK